MSKKALVLLAGLAVMVGCSTVDATATAPVEHRGIAKQAMVGGTVSPSSQDSVVFVMKGDEESCTGTLIAPNLVLTARHCVATPPEDTECGGYTNTASASEMTFKLGASAGWDVGSTAARGKKIFEPTQNDMCGHDVALVLLDRNIGTKTSPVRFTPLEKGEAMVTVGYGVDENDRELPKRMQRSTTVLGVGPATINYRMENGGTFTYEAPPDDIVTGESTCFGDSGGPLFDRNGAVLAMTSRGPLDFPTGGSHGSNGCGDMVSIFASTRANKDLILAAAKEAGHPLKDDSVPDPSTQSTKPAPAGDETGGVFGDDDDDDASSATADDDDDSSDADDDDDREDSKPSKKKSTGRAAVSGGCSSAPRRTGDGWTLFLGVGLALVTAKRRRRARPQHAGVAARWVRFRRRRGSPNEHRGVSHEP